MITERQKLKNYKMYWSFLFAFSLITAGELCAEPWLATRYAQNCAGCHAPGRINLKPIDRRCSLSCQGCHVNPNGGGLRSYYGKWNENRVLRSWILPKVHQIPFAPNKNQKYSKKPFPKLSKKTRKSKKFRNFIFNKGMKLINTAKVDVVDREHDRDANPYTRTARNRIEFLYQVPDQDPYRLKFSSKFDAGVDLRWQYVNNEDAQNKDVTWFMVGDFGLRYRPIYEKYHFVYESRIAGFPSAENNLKASSTRSLYLMADDLPYNTFVMYGFYRPLFGNYSPDHTLLSQKLQALALGAGTAYNIGPYEAITIGTAPNVPYANIHLISRDPIPGDIDSDNSSDLEGFALNTGLRFVSYGASINYSYWKSENKSQKLESELHSLHLAGTLGPVVLNYEGNSYLREDENALKQGGSHFIDINVKAYKEIYGVIQYTSLNVATNLEPGKASQRRIGVRGFLIPGVDLQILFEEEENSPEEGKVAKKNLITSQLHLYM